VPDVKQFRLPDLGEGLTDGDILQWMVAVGDTVEVNQTIAEVETVKAAVELPSPWAGVVTALHAAAGETVPVGNPIISIDVATGAATPEASAGDGAPAAPAAPAAPTAPAAAEDAPAGEEKQMTLVGYGPRENESAPRRRRRPTASASPATQVAFNLPAEPQPAPAVEPAPTMPTVPAPSAATAAPNGGGAHRVLAKPPVRKLAKTLGVDLAELTPTGPNGTISRDDVTQAVEGADRPAARPGPGGPRETRVAIRSVRKHTAAAMVSSAFTAPHVTEFITIDVSQMMALRDRVAARREFRELKVSPLLFLAKAMLLAIGRTPEINTSWDEAAGEIVYKHYVNLGIAAATERGLIVPNIKDADTMSLRELAAAIGELTSTARAGKSTPADLTGGTITITNVGVFGVDTGTPILNPGEAAIVAFGAVRRMPWVVGAGADERIEPRWVTQLAVSFDHRLVDGEQGSRFLADVAAILTDPGMGLL
jgi:pyruvate dehydrogenase E2 component (dihydrolipoamide acetyltransferase)